jgi:hypothetical protein
MRREVVCRVVYRDAKGRFATPPEKPKRVELSPLPSPARVYKDREVVKVEERGRVVRVRFLPPPDIRRMKREARLRGDKEILRQIKEWEEEVKRLAAEDYLKARRSGEWAKRMEKAHRSAIAAKGGKATAKNRRRQKELEERLREKSTSALMAMFQRRGGDIVEKRAIAAIMKERGINLEDDLKRMTKRKRR